MAVQIYKSIAILPFTTQKSIKKVAIQSMLNYICTRLR